MAILQSRIAGDDAAAALIAQLVAFSTGVSAGEIAADRRSRADAARARQISMYLAYVVCQWPLARVGAAFGRDRTTAGHACRQVEDRRDDPDYDRRIDAMERCLRALPEPGAAFLDGVCS